jgi:prevent-host-death family protein
MKNVSVSELKSRLSQYLREVRRGGEIQVLDRGVPVARLTPLPSGSGGHDEVHRRRLIQAGVLRAGRGGASAILETPPLELPVSLVQALDEERADRL